MSEKHLIDHDPELGITQYYHFDEITGDTTLETVWTSDVDEVNREDYKEHSDYGPSRWRGDMHHVARIPLFLLHELRKKGVAQDQKAFARWLDDPDNRIFRTKPGKLGK